MIRYTVRGLTNTYSVGCSREPERRSNQPFTRKRASRRCERTHSEYHFLTSPGQSHYFTSGYGARHQIKYVRALPAKLSPRPFHGLEPTSARVRGAEKSAALRECQSKNRNMIRKYKVERGGPGIRDRNEYGQRRRTVTSSQVKRDCREQVPCAGL